MIEKPEISIIVPVYNVENYLRECLDSIILQDFPDWECILVDDGSTDNSGRICDQYVARDSRFVVIHQPNGGLSSARNVGLKRAKGRFLSFIDSDDWVAPDFLSTLRGLLLDYKADISQINYISVDKGKQKPNASAVETTTILEGEKILIELLRDKMLPSYVWMKMYRREVATTEFPVGVTFEDIVTMTHWFNNAHRVVLSPKDCYYYRYRGSSIMHSNYSQHQLDYFNNVMVRINLVRRFKPHAFSNQQLWKYSAVAALNAAKSIARFESDTEKRIDAIEHIRQSVKMLPISKIKGLGVKKRWRLTLLSKNVTLFSKYIRGILKVELTHYSHRNKRSFE